MKKTLTILTILGFLMLQSTVYAQSNKMTDEEIQEFKQHQLYLDKPAIEIEDIRYEKDDMPIEGELSKDGAKVIMDGYSKRGRVSVTVRYADGTTEKISRSPCYIDPVMPL